jgi:hypothetical protein
LRLENEENENLQEKKKSKVMEDQQMKTIEKFMQVMHIAREI